MTLVTFVLYSGSYATLLMADIAILFVVIRVICSWRKVSILTAFDTTGRPIVNVLTQRVSSWWCRRGRRPRVLSPRQQLALTLVALLMTRVICQVFCALLTLG